MFLKKEMFAVFIHQGRSVLNFPQIIKIISNAFKSIEYNFQLFFLISDTYRERPYLI